MDKLKLLLTSTSTLKKDAVISFFEKIGVPIELECVDGNSPNMPCQPLNDMIFECAQARIDNVSIIRRQENDCSLSIENGIVEMYPTIYDYCVLKVCSDSSNDYYVSFGIPILQDFWNDYKKGVRLIVHSSGKNYYEKTFGQFLAETYKVEANNWMATLNNIDRREQIHDVLSKWYLDYKTEIINNYPKPNIAFKNVETIAIQPQLYKLLLDQMVNLIQRNYNVSMIDYFVGLESRGYYFASVLADRLNKSFLPLRKSNKVPHTDLINILQETYETEYSEDGFGLIQRSEYAGKNCLVLDDLLATGGSLDAACTLLTKTGFNVVGATVVYKLSSKIMPPKQVETVKKWNVQHLICSQDSFVEPNDNEALLDRCKMGDTINHFKKLKRSRGERALAQKSPDKHTFVQTNWTFPIFDMTKIIAGSGSLHLATSISKKLRTPLVDAILGKFGNGETRVEIKENIRDCHIIIVSSTRTGHINDDLWELNFIIDACNRAGVAKKTVVLPYYPYSRSDKKDQPRAPIGAARVSKILKDADNLISLDLHSGQIQGYIDQGFHNLYIVNYMCQYLCDNILNVYPKSQWNSKFILVSPDAGSIKRTCSYAEKLGLNYITLHKQRDYSKPGVVVSSQIIGEEEIYRNRTAILIDDMADSMGTMVAAIQTLVDHGMKDAIIAITHGIFSGKAIERMNNCDNLISVITTNSLPQDENVKLCPKIEILDCSELISRALDGIITGKSISQLFS